MRFFNSKRKMKKLEEFQFIEKLYVNTKIPNVEFEIYLNPSG